MRIKFNGQEVETYCETTTDFFKSKSQDISDIWIVNGFATKEMIRLQENDELFCISKNVLPPEEALDAMMRSRHTPLVHQRLKTSKIAICGLGGLGSHIAIMLARSGVGKLILIDFDSVDASNLNRQSYRVNDLGRLKTEALRDQIREINPFILIEIYTLRITDQNLEELFVGCDIVCEAFDNVESKKLLMQNFHFYFEHIPLICASGMAGYGDSNSIQTHRIAKNLYICGDLKNQAQVGRGLMAPRVTLCAAHQANLALELLMQKEK